ncbi:MAG: hypothetical protein ACHQHM_01715 [Thermoanaerobaculales bacterium]
MRSLAISATCAVALLVAASAGDAHSRHRTAPTCPPGHSHVLLADQQALVYTIGECYIERPEFGPAVAVPYVGIRGRLRGQRRSYLLGVPDEAYGGGAAQGSGGIEHEVLSGSMVAYEESGSATSYNGPSEYEWVVVVRDLRNGRVVHRRPTGTPLEPEPNYVGVGKVASLVLKSDGAVAWLAEDYERSAGTGTYLDLYAVDALGSRLLASGHIKRRSLRLSGSMLYWIEHGKTASARLD